MTGYRKDLIDETLEAQFNEDSVLRLDPDMVGACRTLLSGIVGEGLEIGQDYLKEMRPSEVSYYLAKHVLFSRFRRPNEPAPMHLFYPLQRIVRRWIDEGYLKCSGGTHPAMATYQDIAEKAAELIYAACQRAMGADKGIKAVLDPYNPSGSTH